MASGRSRVAHYSMSPSGNAQASLQKEVLCIVTPCEWGPISTEGATEVISWPDFQKKFGGYLANYYGPLSVENFFKGKSGRRVIVSRIVHMSAGSPVTAAKAYKIAQTGATSPTYGTVTGTVAEPFSLADGDTIIISADGGGDDTATFNATAASVTTYAAETYNITPGSTIQVAIDGGSTQTVTFSSGDFVNIAAATAEEVAAVMNAALTGCSVTTASTGTKVKITSDTLGTGSSVNIVEVGGGIYGTDANAVLMFPVATASGTGDAANAASVTNAELKTLIEGDVSGVTCGTSGSYLTIRTNTAGASGSIQVKVASTADTKCGLDNAVHTGTSGGATNTLKIEGKYYGARANSFTYTIANASNGDTDKFDLLVYEDGVLIADHHYQNLTMDDTDTTNYVENVINLHATRSDYITVTDQDAPGTASQARPANATAQALTGGDDGLTSLDSNDFIGSATYNDGLYAFSLIDQGDLLIIPDDTSTALQNLAISYCADQKDSKMIFIPDPPASTSYTGMKTHAQALTASEARTGLYWPRVKITNPDKAIYGQADDITVPPSGLVAGRMAKNTFNDPNEQMWRNPANQVYGLLEFATGLETEAVNDPDIRDYIADFQINPIVSGIRYSDNNFGIWIDDAQAGKISGNFKSVGEIRGIAYLRKQLEAATEIHRVQGNSQDSRQALHNDFVAILLPWVTAGVFETKNADDAFYVNTDIPGTSINNAVVRESQQLNAQVGVATRRSARIINIFITRDQRAVQSYIQQQLAQSGNA